MYLAARVCYALEGLAIGLCLADWHAAWHMYDTLWVVLDNVWYLTTYHQNATVATVAKCNRVTREAHERTLSMRHWLTYGLCGLATG